MTCLAARLRLSRQRGAGRPTVPLHSTPLFPLRRCCSDYEIFSYLLSGALEHKDSMGNREVLTRGDVQFTSAGRGIRHSEFNADRTVPVRFLQVRPKAAAPL